MRSECLFGLRLRVILLTIAVSIVTVVFLRDKSYSDGRTAFALEIVNGAILLAFTFRFRDAALARLLVFGLTLGVVELAADALCVTFTRTLDYSVSRSFLIGLSPFWMPTAWMIVAVQIGYVGVCLMQRFGDRPGIALTALLGAVNIPFYEEMAWHAHWWRYQNCRMLGHTPLYIILAELVIACALAPLARAALNGDTCRALFAGVLGGLSTIGGGLVGYGLIEIVPRWF